MDDKEKQFGKRGRIKRQSKTSSADKSPTSDYALIPMSDNKSKTEGITNYTLGENKSSEFEGNLPKEDIKKWMQENIKLRPYQDSSKNHGVKKKTVQSKILNAGKSREEREETRSVKSFSSSHRLPLNDIQQSQEETYEVLMNYAMGKQSGEAEFQYDRASTPSSSSSSLPQPLLSSRPSPLPQPSLSSPPSPLSSLSSLSSLKNRHDMLASSFELPRTREEEEERSSEESFSSNDEISCDEEEASIPSRSTDAFGEVKFIGYGRKIAKFARVDHETPMKIMMDLITDVWNLSSPKILISVTGGRKDFQLNSHLKEAFGCGLVKAATSTGGWIISAGLHAGVVKYIGKAIYDNESTLTDNNKVETVSIAPWNCVRNNDILRNKEGSWPSEYEITDDSTTGMYALDPNHSHFILIDDGTSNTFGQEIEFRKELENTILQQKIRETEVRIPVIAVMVGGGSGTLKSVCDSISRNIPVIIVKGSGGAADIMAYAYQILIGNEDEKDENKTESYLQMQLENEIRNKIGKEFEYNKQIELLVKCVLDSLKQPNLVTIFGIDSAEEFDVAVLKALFKANNNKLENLSLALEWNRIDIAKNELFTEDILWPTGTLDNCMLSALRNDRVDFVKLFMEHGVSLKKFLTKENIENLYSMENKDISIKDGASLLNIIMDDDDFTEKKIGDLQFAKKLFLWAIILNRKEMAFLFWKEGMDALPSALIAKTLLESLKEQCENYDKRIQLQEHADLYEERAIGVLTKCYYANEKKTLDLLLLRRKTWNYASCMQIAFNVSNKQFVSQASCQSLLTKIWMGKMSKKNTIWKLLLCTLCPLFIFLIDFRDKQVSHENTKEPCCSKPRGKCCTVFCRCVSFYNTPVIKFVTNLIFYIIFLGIYSYVLLVELKPQVSYLEWILVAWIIGLFTEELHQIFKREMMFTKSSKSLWSKFVNYINDVWNLIDVITIVMFCIGYTLRFWKLDDAARVILCLNLITFFMRLLNMLSVHRHLGPKLVMIKKMMQDLGYFIIILFFLMFAYGIAAQSILYPSTPVSYDLFKAVFRKAYFHMYGELFLDEYEGDTNCNVDSSKCPSEVGTYVVPILMSIYILLMNILLLNLLIAMFSSTFQKVQEKSRLHWSFQRYKLIFEFCIRPPLPPPFIMLSNIYQCCRYLYRKARHLHSNKKSAFSRTYETDEEKKLILWEHQMVNSYIPTQNKSNSDNKKLIDQLTSKVQEQVCVLSSRTEQLTSKVEELQINVEEKRKKNADKIDTILALLKKKL